MTLVSGVAAGAATRDCAIDEGATFEKSRADQSDEGLGVAIEQGVTSRRGDLISTSLPGGSINLDSDTARVSLTAPSLKRTYLALFLSDKTQYACAKIFVRLAYVHELPPSKADGAPYKLVEVSNRASGSGPGSQRRIFAVDEKTLQLRSPVMQGPFALLRLDLSDDGQDTVYYIKDAAKSFRADPNAYEFALQREILAKLRQRIIQASDAAYNANHEAISLADDDQRFVDTFSKLPPNYRAIHRMIVGSELGLDVDALKPRTGRNARSIFAPADAVILNSGLSFGPYQIDFDQGRWELPLVLKELNGHFAAKAPVLSSGAIENLRGCFYTQSCPGGDKPTGAKGIRRYGVDDMLGYEDFLPYMTEYLQSPRGQKLVYAFHQWFLMQASACRDAAETSFDGLADKQRLSLLFVDGFNQHGARIAIDGSRGRGAFQPCLEGSNMGFADLAECVGARRAAMTGRSLVHYQSGRGAWVEKGLASYKPSDGTAPILPSNSDPEIAELIGVVRQLAGAPDDLSGTCGTYARRLQPMVGAYLRRANP
ncbi:hypothetical protein [Caulobacter sp. LARHSG274]